MNLLSIAIAALLVSFSHLQAAALTVRFLAWDEQIATRKLGAENLEIKGLHPLQRTSGYKVTVEDGTFQIQALDKKNEKGEPALLTIKTPAEILKPLVILLPKKDTPTGLAAVIIEDDESSLKWGNIRVINSTARELAMAVGAVAKVLPAGWTPVDFEPKADETLPVLIALPEELRKPADSRQGLFSTIWTGEENVRALAIIAPGTDVRLGPVAVKVVTEDRRVIEAQRAAAQKH